jgi:hypothetical protein
MWKGARSSADRSPAGKSVELPGADIVMRE